MAQSIEYNLLQAIKNDDIKAFNALMEKAQCGAYRLGRFPVLSLMYLYKSRALLFTYEETFLKITSYELLHEPVEISKKFMVKAGKCLRLYLKEIVSPLEMLMIMNNRKRLKRVYPLTKPTEAIKERLKSIYYIRYSLNVRYDGNNIIIDRRPLSYQEKKKIATICLCSLLAITFAVGAPVTTVALIPKPIEGEVRKLSQIDFDSQEEYTLKRDIILPEDYTIEKVNCTIYGEGNKLILSNGVILGELNGKISDLIIESNGLSIFNSVSEKGEIEKVTVNISTDFIATESTALVAVTNYGTIDGVTVNVCGKINAHAISEEVTEEFYIGGIVLNNSYKTNSSNKTFWGTIKNCTVNFSKFSLIGEASADAAFGGVVAINDGYVQDCTITGEIISDTFDIAGVCLVNNGLLSANINEADLSQTSSDTGWNPIVCGIVLNNTYVVEYCNNKGVILAVSQCEQSSELTVSAAGIAAMSYSGDIYYSLNEGDITAIGGGTVYTGGIVARSSGLIYNCVSQGDINVKAQTVFAGGIMGISDITYYYPFYFGLANACISENKIYVNCTEAYVGGVVGGVRELGLNNGKLYYGGGVTNSYFTGECNSDITYFGNIVGVCGTHIYENNYYTSGFEVYYNFVNNYYSDNGFTAFGAIVTEDNEFISVDDKGAESADLSDIKNSEGYKAIIAQLKNN